MTDYTKTTDFTSKDSLPSGDSGKIIRGAEFGTEFDNIETAVNSKSNIDNPSFTGNITVTGTVDGRDIAADGTKLDTIETSADVTDTANVTAAGAVMDSELTDITAVKALNQGVATTDSPTFAAVTSTGNVTVGGTVDGRDVAADGTKLDTVETNADVTDTTNVTAAGALMDSEVTNLDQVKAFDSADYATAAQGTTADNALPKTGGAMTGAITTNSTFDGRDVATDGTKLDGIEASADVTDTANVTAAGALMDSELTSEASVKALNQGVATTDSPTFAGAAVNGTVEFDGLSGTGAVTVTDILDQDDMSGNSATALATQQSIKSYVDSQVATSDTLAEVLANGNTTGGTDVAFGDNDKAIFGASSDLQIYHDGSGSYIDDQGTGPIRIRSGVGGALRFQDLDGDDLINATSNGAVTLYHNNSAKLATTSTGIDVTGSVVSDGLTVDGDASVAGTVGVTADNGTITTGKDSASSRTHWSMNNPNGEVAKWDSNGTDLLHFITDEYKVYTAGNKAFEIDGNGDISFYEDTGTTAKLFWDASAESLGIGTSSPETNLHIEDSSSFSIIRLVSSTTENAGIDFGDPDDRDIGRVRYNNSDNSMVFHTNAAERMRIDSAGNVGIGATSLSNKLTVNGDQVLLANGELKFADAGNNAVGVIRNSASAGTSQLEFLTASTERMRIDSSGNVNIYGTDNRPLAITSFATASAGAGWDLDATSGNGVVTVSTGGSERMRIDSDGNVGIGTDSPRNDANFKTLQIGDSSTAASQLVLDDNDSSGPWRIISNLSLIINDDTDERMRIDSNGTAMFKGGTTDNAIQIWESNSEIARIGGSSGTLNFLVGSTTESRMAINSSGNVGIGTSSPSNKLQIIGGTSGVDQINLASNLSDNTVKGAGIVMTMYTNNTAALIGGSAVNGATNLLFGSSGTDHRGIQNHIWYTNTNYNSTSGNTERMRLDSSGTLNLGTTLNVFGGADRYGYNFYANGQSNQSIDGTGDAVVQYINRENADGPFTKFYKDRVEVGSIGNRFGAMYIHSPDGTLGAGLRFFDGVIQPCESNGNDSNGDTDLGQTNSRFKDLYLSGGAYLGGTGSANHLDDYEEGTFTPTLGGGTSFGTTTYTTQTGTYTKIGDTVHLRIYLDVSATTGSGFLKIGGIPFTVASLGSIGAFLPSGLNWGGGSYLQSYAAGGDAFLRVYYATDNANWQAQQVTNETQQILITIAYQAS